MRRLLSILTLLITTTIVTTAQEYRFEVGPGLGISGYLGDTNDGNLYKHPGITGGAVFRYIGNSRWAIKANLIYARVSGDTENISSQFPLDHDFKFSANLYDLSVHGEFNFLSYGIGPQYKKYKRWTPYLLVGIGAVMSSSGATNVSLVTPLGLGVKFKLKERLNLGFEFTMRKEYGDKIDNITDLYGIKHSFAKNTDWYSIAMFTITYEFSKRCSKCHYIE